MSYRLQIKAPSKRSRRMAKCLSLGIAREA
jgi:hypothetical protein